MSDRQYYHPDTDQFRKWDVPLPTAESHGTEQELSENMKQLLPSEWRLEGNKLIGKTEMGELVQTIPTDYILEGTDSKGLPKFRKVVL